ncbi:MAG: DUF533 domain-containing protein [Acidobacteriota bacterium]|nr:DUF533 domain-containing protein [Acidobacteriota bacterium]
MTPEVESTATVGEAILMLRAMVAAANADHELDTEERARIERATTDVGVSEDERQFLRTEMEHPWSLKKLAESVSSLELAREVYLASLMAIDVDSAAEAHYLRKLAERLGLDQMAVEELEGLLEPEDSDE